MGSQTHQLDRLGRELKCPICLSLLQQAASLTCNHTFCRSCILQSMKSKPACPICKVHTTRREVRAAPQMDSLVAIFVSMGSAAGLDIMASQNVPSTGEPIQAPTTSRGRTALSNITNRQKSLQIPKETDYTFKGPIPAKKRIQVPQPSALQGELEANRDVMHSTLHSHLSTDKCGLTTVGPSPKSSSRSKRKNKEKGSPDELDASRSNPSRLKKVNMGAIRQNALDEPSCSKQVDIKHHGREKETLKETSTHLQASPPNRKKHGKRKGKDMVPLTGSQLVNNVEKDSDLPVRDDSSRRKLDPFFWLRDESSQERDAIQVTQLTLTQSTVRPNFSDLKDSDDDEFGLDANEEITNSIGVCGPGNYDSDDFDWTQHPCSPELRCSPSKNQESTEDLVIDVPLESSHPSTKELSSDDKNAYKQDIVIISAETLLESASKVSSIAQEILDAALKEDKKRRKSGRMKAHHETHKAAVLPVRTQITNTQQQNNRAGCSNGPQSELPISDMIPSENKLINAKSNSKRNAEKPSKLKRKRAQENSVAGCSIKPTSHTQPCNIFPSEELKPSGSSERNYDKPVKLSKRKRGPDSNVDDARNDNVPSKSESSKKTTEPVLPVCVFCGVSNNSQITGSMMHFNQQGAPLAEPGHDGKIVHVHKHCAEWAPDVYFVKDEARNLSAEVARGLKIKCFSCGKRGAALGCCIKRCRRSYHYPCACALSCKWEEERFIMLCPEHKAEEFPVKKNQRCRASARAAHSAEIPIKRPDNAGVGLIEEISVKWACSQSSKWVLCGSALDAAGKNQLATFAKVSGATISKAWSSNVTHVVAGTDLHGAARRTMKFLMAILEGKWVVRLEWMAACIEAGKPVSEEPFEIGTDIHGAIKGPKQGRLRAAGEGPKLFGKLQFYFMPDFLSPYKGDLQALVLAGGGVFLHRKPVTLVDDDAGKRKTVVVYNNENPSNDKKADRGKLLMSKRQAEAQELAAFVGANVVPHQWILNSIGSSKVQPLD